MSLAPSAFPTSPWLTGVASYTRHFVGPPAQGVCSDVCSSKKNPFSKNKSGRKVDASTAANKPTYPLAGGSPPTLP